MSALPERAPKIVQFPHPSQVRPVERTSGMALKVRGHLSLLQGYADIMEGVSPQLRAIIRRVMAGKAREMGTMLQPFSDTGRRPISEYRHVRGAPRKLRLEYPPLLGRLH